MKTHSLLSHPSVTAVAVVGLGLAAVVNGAPVIDPTGATYTGVSASSSFSSGYLPGNLFNLDLTHIQVGYSLEDGAEWATQGSLDGYVAFQLGGVYSVSSLYYAQRNSNVADIDQMNLARIWASQTTPFDPMNPPGTNPDAFIVLTNANGSPTWTEYPLPGNIAGQYFLVELVQTNGNCCNPGGRELRLGGTLLNANPPAIALEPANHTIYTGGNARFSIVASGTPPFGYQWRKGSTVLTDDARISGAGTPNLLISGVSTLDAGSCTCTVTNQAGSTNSAAATLAVVAKPKSAMANLILSSRPVAYYRFQENLGDLVAADLFNSTDAAYGGSSILGEPGPVPPAFPGLDATNTALGTTFPDANSVVTVPPLNLNTNTVTMIAWVNPTGQQDPYATLLAWRDSGNHGYGMLAYGGQLGWIWQDWGWSETTGLTLPQDQWSMAVVVVTPTNGVLYLGANGALRTYVSANANPNGAFDTLLTVGSEPNGSRVFNGHIDEVAIFSHCLTADQVQAIYAAGVGQVPAGITQQPVSRTNYVGGTARFGIVARGSTPVYQWLKETTPLVDGGKISGSRTANLAIASVATSDGGTYSCLVSNSLGTDTSAPATLTVMPAPATGYDAAILAYRPVAFWQLNDAQGAASAVDYWGSFDGTPLPDAVLGVNGPRPPDFPGFAGNNTALQTAAGDGNSSIAVPGLNLNANTATILMWIYPIGHQASYTSMFANRSGGYAALNYLDDGATLSFQWDSYGWNSGILVPSDQWDLVGMVITPTNTTVYLGSGGVLTNNAQVINNPVLSYAGTSYIGSDSGNDTRVFNGFIDGVAVFNRSLSSNDVAVVYGAALGLTPPPPILNWSVTSSGLVLAWGGPWTLMQADSVDGPWSPATGVVSGTPIPVTGTIKFYRLQN